MKIAIVGSRNFESLHLIARYIEQLPNDTTIISGGAFGVDSYAERIAKKHSLKTIVHLPNWNEYGKRAGFIRNQLIVNDADKVVAFWNGISRGTKHSIELARKAGKEIEIIDEAGRRS